MYLRPKRVHTCCQTGLRIAFPNRLYQHCTKESSGQHGAAWSLWIFTTLLWEGAVSLWFVFVRKDGEHCSIWMEVEDLTPFCFSQHLPLTPSLSEAGLAASGLQAVQQCLHSFPLWLPQFRPSHVTFCFHSNLSPLSRLRYLHGIHSSLPLPPSPPERRGTQGHPTRYQIRARKSTRQADTWLL